MYLSYVSIEDHTNPYKTRVEGQTNSFNNVQRGFFIVIKKVNLSVVGKILVQAFHTRIIDEKSLTVSGFHSELTLNHSAIILFDLEEQWCLIE